MKVEIQQVDRERELWVQAYIDTLTKPPGSLGRLEEIARQLAAITKTDFPVVTPPGVIVFAADHGIAAEGVSAFPQEVTAQMVRNFLSGGAAINVFSRQIAALLQIVDVGVACEIEADELVKQKVRYGTANFYKEDAMSREEAEKAITIGYEQACKLIKQGARCLILGEMGIANTTASSAIVAVLGSREACDVVGRGSGIDEEKIVQKQRVIEQAIISRNPNPNDPIDVLTKVGGLEIAAMAGAMLGAATHHVPILIDGFICTAAALVAKEICPHIVDYMIVGHQSAEQGHKLAIEMLGKKPLLDLGLRLGEGSGAAVAFSVVQSAALMLREMATFQSAGVSKKV